MTDAATQDYINNLNDCPKHKGAKIQKWVDCSMDPWTPSLPEGWEEVPGSWQWHTEDFDPRYHKWSDRVRSRSIRPIK